MKKKTATHVIDEASNLIFARVQGLRRQAHVLFQYSPNHLQRQRPVQEAQSTIRNTAKIHRQAVCLKQRVQLTLSLSETGQTAA